MAQSRLHLLHLASPALPIGAYAYSQGLEYAIEAGWLANDKLDTWLCDGLMLGVAQLDLPILMRVFAALDTADHCAVNHWNDTLLASRETAELLLEDQQVGAALLRLLTTLHAKEIPIFEQPPGYAVAFALACHQWAIELDAALAGYSYSWL